MERTRRARVRNLSVLAAWSFIAVAVAAAVTGLAYLYAHPDTLRIEAFSDLYGRLGLPDSLMITVLLVLPFGCAVLAAGVVVWRRPGDRAAMFLAVGLVAVYLFVSGAIIGIGTVWVRDLVGSAAFVMTTWFLAGFPTASIIPSFTTPSDDIPARWLRGVPSLRIGGGGVRSLLRSEP